MRRNIAPLPVKEFKDGVHCSTNKGGRTRNTNLRVHLYVLASRGMETKFFAFLRFSILGPQDD